MKKNTGINELSQLKRKQVHRESKKREAQVNVRLTPEFYARLRKACALQEHKEGQLIRILVEWALPFYEQSESVKGLKSISESKLKSLLSDCSLDGPRRAVRAVAEMEEAESEPKERSA